MTSVLLVDDHELVREGLAGVLAAQDDLEVVGAAGTVAEAGVKVTPRDSARA